MFTVEMNQIFEKLKSNLPTIWDGQESILYMKDNGCTQWRQMEWPGFYFQFMCERILGKDGFMDIPGPKYGNVVFDGFKTIPWDFKAHSIDKDKKDTGKIPTNGYAESLQAISEYGQICFIIITGDSDYDDSDQSFKKWHDELKGGTSKYEEERIARSAPSRRRKINFKPQELIFVFVDNDNIGSCGKFQGEFRNSNGVPRNSKIMIDLKNPNLKIFRFKF